jgi:sugar phosphate permease
MTTIGILPVATGNVLLLMSVGMIIGSLVCGWFSDSLFKARKGVIVAGLSGMSVVLAVLAGLSQGTSLTVLSALFLVSAFSPAPDRSFMRTSRKGCPLNALGRP